MTLVDSSAWVELLRATGNPVHVRLRELISSNEELHTTGAVQMELLAGARSKAERQTIRAGLAACRTISIADESDWQDAASIYVTCRRAGVTPRRLLDCLIATVAIRTGIPVLAMDRDFERIAEHTSLELAA